MSVYYSWGLRFHQTLVLELFFGGGEGMPEEGGTLVGLEVKLSQTEFVVAFLVALLPALPVFG